MSKKLVILIGKCAVGKSEVDKRLGELGFNRCISHTTRPARPSEQNGIDYHFISAEEYDDMQDQFLETTDYIINKNQWKYGLHKDSIKEGYNVVVVNPSGLMQILEAKPEDVEVFVVWLKAPLATTIVRFLTREGDTLETRSNLIDRLIRDSKDFDNKLESKLCRYEKKGTLTYWMTIDNSTDIDYRLDFIIDYILDILVEFQ